MTGCGAGVSAAGGVVVVGAGAGAGTVVGATGGVIVTVGTSCAKAAGVDRVRNAAIALMAGRERAIVFIIVTDKRMAREKRCRKPLLSGARRAQPGTG